MNALTTDTLTPVPDPTYLPGTLGERMESLGLNVTTLSRLSGVKSRSTVYKALRGEEVLPSTLRKIEHALDVVEQNPDDAAEQPGAVMHDAEGGMIEFEVNVEAMGVRVAVRAPAGQAELAAAQVAKIIQDMRLDAQDDGPQES